MEVLQFFIIIGTFLFLYFFFNLLDGERGLISLLKKETKLTQLKFEEEELKQKIMAIPAMADLASGGRMKDSDVKFVNTLIGEEEGEAAEPDSASNPMVSKRV